MQELVEPFPYYHPWARHRVHRTMRHSALLAGLLAAGIGAAPLLAAPAESAPPTTSAPDGAALYASRCAACHDDPRDRTPPRIYLATFRTPDEIVSALTDGVMRPQAAGLDASEIRALAVYLTGRQPREGGIPLDTNRCRKTGARLRLGQGDWNGWGRDLTNTRYHPAPGLTAHDMPRLRLRWAFAYPGNAAYGQPVVVGNRLFGGGAGGYVFSLDASTGCTHWFYAAGNTVRTAVVVGPIPDRGPARYGAFFGDDKGRLHAVDAVTGKPLWVVSLDDHPLARVLGTPQVHRGRIYATVSSGEEVAAADPKYACCTFRGSVLALDAATGRVLWKSPVIREAPRPFRVNSAGTQMYGPAGGAIFSAPTIDEKRGVLYVGTGDAYTDVRSDSTNAILALDLDTGERRWTRQVIEHDAWILGCDAEKPSGNCPHPLGPDFDFAASPILVTLPGGRQILVAGAKSGIVYGLDPDDDGRLLWQIAVVRGSPDGGILWGLASDGRRVYVATSEYNWQQGRGPGGLVAIDPADGRLLWQTPAPERPCAWGAERCSSGQIAAVTVIPGVVFAGALDGRIRAYSAEDGSILWEFDTGRAFPDVKGGTAKGGAIDYGGQVIANGMLYVHSGSARQPGNALLAFGVDAE